MVGLSSILATKESLDSVPVNTIVKFKAGEESLSAISLPENDGNDERLWSVTGYHYTWKSEQLAKYQPIVIWLER